MWSFFSHSFESWTTETVWQDTTKRSHIFLNITPHSPSSSLSFSGIFNSTTLTPWKTESLLKSLLTSLFLFQSVFLPWIFLLLHSHLLLCPSLMPTQQKLPPWSLYLSAVCKPLLLHPSLGSPFFPKYLWTSLSQILKATASTPYLYLPTNSCILKWKYSAHTKLEFILMKLISICNRPKLTNSLTAPKVTK